MKYRNILVPYDRSEHSRRALETAREFAESNADATVSVITVVYGTGGTMPNDLILGDVGLSPVDYQAEEEMFDNMVAAARADMEDVGGAVLESLGEGRVSYAVVVHPSVADGIGEYASEHECDLIIMGRRGLSGLRGLLGSVAQGVLKKADVPVLTVK